LKRLLNEPCESVQRLPVTCWSVDASPDHSLKEEHYRLWLSNPLALYGVENSKPAPGYRPPVSALKK
jgi:hypothetical protein